MWILNKITFDASAVDGKAWTIFLTGLIVVMIAQWLIGVFLKQFQNILAFQEKKRNKKKNNIQIDEQSSQPKINIAADTDEEVKVAVAMALHLYFNEQHDEESYVLTIDTADRLMSPWAKKSFSPLKK